VTMLNGSRNLVTDCFHECLQLDEGAIARGITEVIFEAIMLLP